MKRLTVAGMILGMMLLVAASSFGAAVPQVINYSGTLTNKAGAAVPDGKYDIEFNVYDVPTGGAALWTEKWSTTATPASPVLAVGGVFNVMLGAITPFPNGFFADNPNTYLGIKVGADTEMLPRQKVASVGYAFAAGNGVPKGGVIMWSGAVAAIPDGWALCDGTNGTPNLKDRFVVGAGGGYTNGQTGGEAAHVLTISEMPWHNHGVNDPGHNHGMGAKESTTAGQTAIGGATSRTLTLYSDTSYTGISTQNTGGGAPHNNLPPYYALAFIMKL